jgi:hypothetical protein
MGAREIPDRGFDAVVMAGDRGAYRPVYGKNKALLEIDGAPVLAHLLSALQRSRHVSRIFVVGPREEIAEALARSGDRAHGPKEVRVVGQWETVLENAWNTFLITLSSDAPEGRVPPAEDLEKRFADRVVLFLGADIPLLTPEEVDEFIQGCDLTRYDYLLGTTPEEALAPYYPEPEKPGIRFAYFCFRDSRERQNNLHLIRVFRVVNREIIQKMYQYRHQRRWWSVARLLWTLLRARAVTFTMVLKFLLLHLCLVLDRGFARMPQSFLRRFLAKQGIEQDVSRVLGARFGSVVTTYGGAALDVDSEEQFEIIRGRFREWTAFQEELRQRRKSIEGAS